VAAGLKEAGHEPVLVRGALGELSVTAGDRKLVDSSRLLYPRPSTVVRRALAELEGPQRSGHQ
jgi:hypothetical protein